MIGFEEYIKANKLDDRALGDYNLEDIKRAWITASVIAHLEAIGSDIVKHDVGLKILKGFK